MPDHYDSGGDDINLRAYYDRIAQYYIHNIIYRRIDNHYDADDDNSIPHLHNHHDDRPDDDDAPNRAPVQQPADRPD